MADVLQVTFIILGFYVTTVAYWVAARGLVPKAVERCATRYGETPWRCLIVGLLVGVPMVTLGLAMANGGAAPVKTVGILLVMVVFLRGLFGSAGLCQRMGQGLRKVDDEGQEWLGVKRGGTVLGLMMIFPVLGWFLVIPVTLLSGMGALFLSWRDGRKMPPPLTEA
ncbi:hypothetical protein OAF46_03125 [Akkermansiaceae bacterium]|nr:hypothetical protein [Akkermansiaceae bacterium]